MHVHGRARHASIYIHTFRGHFRPRNMRYRRHPHPRLSLGFGARAHSARSQLAAWKFSALGGVPAPFSSQRTIFGMELLGFTGKDKCDMMYMDMCAYICIYIYTQNMFVLGCHKRGKFEQKYDVICLFVSWATRMDKEWLALTN